MVEFEELVKPKICRGGIGKQIRKPLAQSPNDLSFSLILSRTPDLDLRDQQYTAYFRSFHMSSDINLTDTATEIIEDSAFAKRILLTGVTGFVGQAILLEMIFRQPKLLENATLTVMIREKNGISARDRFNRLLEQIEHLGFKKPEISIDILCESLETVKADGLNCFTHIIHCASAINFDQASLSTNVFAFNNFLNECNHPSLKRLVYISTAYVSEPGLAPASLVPIDERLALSEGDLSIIDSFCTSPYSVKPSFSEKGRFVNYYAFSKFLAEHLLDRFSFSGNTEKLIIRPSVVVPAVSFPAPYWFKGSAGLIGHIKGAAAGIYTMIDVYQYGKLTSIIPSDIMAKFIVSESLKDAAFQSTTVIHAAAPTSHSATLSFVSSLYTTAGITSKPIRNIGSMPLLKKRSMDALEKVKLATLRKFTGKNIPNALVDLRYFINHSWDFEISESLVKEFDYNLCSYLIGSIQAVRDSLSKSSNVVSPIKNIAAPKSEEYSRSVINVTTLIIGAGTSGLSVAYYLKRQGKDCKILESSSVPGFAWTQRLHFEKISSPAHKVCLPGMKIKVESKDGTITVADYAKYLKMYAKKMEFDIDYNTKVTAACYNNGIWTIETGSSKVFQVKNLVVASGKYEQPLIPHLDGILDFKGLVKHSSDIKDLQEFRNKKVVVLGLGNSGLDIGMLMLNSNIVSKVVFSVRTIPTILPMKLFGPIKLTSLQPITDRLPTKINNSAVAALEYAFYGNKLRKSFPPTLQKWKPFTSRRIPTLDHYGFYRYVKSGSAVIKPNIKRIQSNTIVFDDGSEYPCDLLIYATGMTANIYFIDDNHKGNAHFVGFSKLVKVPIQHACSEAKKLANIL